MNPARRRDTAPNPDAVTARGGPVPDGGAPVDLTSSLFLGRGHHGLSLPPWDGLTTGRPAALGEPAAARRLVEDVAAAQGAQAGTVARSSLHALLDIVTTLPRPGDVLAIDDASYPITRWASDVAARRGVDVRTYPHHRPPRPPRQPRGRSSGRVWVATDGWCPGCNRAAPLRQLNDLAVEGGGALIVDDTLAFGVLGRRRSAAGFGDGTGTPGWCGLHHRGIVWVASLAKAHGSPLAVISGDHEPIAALRSDGGTRAHCSPPTAADLAAALASVEDIPGNRARRALLEDRVHRVRRRLGRAGLTPVGAPFPLVAVPLRDPDGPAGVARLRRNGVRGLALTSRCTGRPMLCVLLRADVSTADVDRSADALVAAAWCGSTGHRSAS